MKKTLILLILLSGLSFAQTIKVTALPSATKIDRTDLLLLTQPATGTPVSKKMSFQTLLDSAKVIISDYTATIPPLSTSMLNSTEALELPLFHDARVAWQDSINSAMNKIDDAVIFFDPNDFVLSGDTLQLNTILVADTLMQVETVITNNDTTLATSGAIVDYVKKSVDSLNTLNKMTNVAYKGQSNDFGNFTQTSGTFNATSALQINGTSINTTGTLSKVAYKEQNNNFITTQTIAGDVRLANASTDRSFAGNDNTGRILIGGGNGAGGVNGASIYLAGNTYASNPGRLTLLAGQQSETGKGDIIFRTGSSSQYYMTMNYLGNVRIGSSTDATEKLDVAGNIKASASVSSVGTTSSVSLTHSSVAPQVIISDINTGYSWYLQHRMDTRNQFQIRYYNGVSFRSPFTIELDAPNNSITANSVGVGINTAYSSITDALTVTGNIKASGTVTATDHIAGSANYFYFGAEGTDGSWRIGRSGNNLVFERRESGSWVTKSTLTP